MLSASVPWIERVATGDSGIGGGEGERAQHENGSPVSIADRDDEGARGNQCRESEAGSDKWAQPHRRLHGRHRSMHEHHQTVPLQMCYRRA